MVSEKKALQRHEILARRDQMDGQVRVRLSRSVVVYADTLFSHPAGQIIAAFLPIRSEIDARPLMAYLQNQGAHLALPALLNKPNKHIVFRAFDREDTIVAMDFGTSGPSEMAPVVEPDLIFLPLAAYDGQGNRIGYGGGYYDRAIAGMRARGLNPHLVGLAFSCQEIEQVAVEPHDIKLDAILTEKGLTFFDKKTKN